MAWREADHPALTRDLAGAKEGTVTLFLGVIIREQKSRKIIPEDIGVRVSGILFTTDTRIARTESAGGIVGRAFVGDLLNLSEPGALGAMR